MGDAKFVKLGRFECRSCRAILRTSRWRRRAIVLALAAAFSYGIFAIATPLNVRSRPLPVFAFVGAEIAAVPIFLALRPFEIHRRPHGCRVCGYDVHACTGERCP